jgi:hypothetical protein
MLADFFYYAWSLVWSWLGLIAGGLGALIAVYEKVKKQEVHPKRYIMILLGFLVLAGFMNWREEREHRVTAEREMKEAQARLEQERLPSLKLAISQIAVGEMANGSAAVTIFAGIRNTGAPSIITNWRLIAQIPNKRPVEGQRYHYTGSFTYLTEDDKALEFDEASRLDEKVAESPLQTGAEKRGVLLFAFHRLTREQVGTEGTVFSLVFEDVRGKEYVTKYDFTGPIYHTPAYEMGVNARVLTKKELQQKQFDEQEKGSKSP